MGDTCNADIKPGYQNRRIQTDLSFYTEKRHFKNSYKEPFKEAIIGDDTMNFARFEGKGLDVDELIRLADTMPFFAERRLILVEDSGFLRVRRMPWCSICHPCRIPPFCCL